MNIALSRGTRLVSAALLVSALGACAIGGNYDGYDRSGRTQADRNVAYDIGFYEPYTGNYYGGWRNDYRVGPPRHGSYQHTPRFRPSSGARGYETAPLSRFVPSIATAPRGPRPGGAGGGVERAAGEVRDGR